MKTIALVIRYEIGVIAGGKAFWIFTLALPLMLFAANLFLQNQFGQTVSNEIITPMVDPNARVIHYVDEANLIERLPDSFAADQLLHLKDEEAGMAQLAAGEIMQFFVIDPAYLENGRILIFTEQSLPIMGMVDARRLEDLLAYNLLADANTAVLFIDPIAEETLTVHRVEKGVGATENFGFLTVIFTFFFLFLFSGGQYMLRSLSRETKNRTLELLLLSVDVRHFMWGKLIGLSLIALFQILLWGVLFSLVALPFRQTPVLPEGLSITAVPETPALLEFPPEFLFWGGIYLFLGFFMMTALFLLIGVVAPKTHFAVQISSIIMFLMLFVFGLNFIVIAEPDSVVGLLLSVFPFSAPISMTTRLAVSSPPLWQIGLSLFAILLTIYFLVWLATRLIRADRMLAGVSLLRLPMLRRSADMQS